MSLTKNKLMENHVTSIMSVFFNQFFVFLNDLPDGARDVSDTYYMGRERHEKTLSRVGGFQTQRVQLIETQDWHFTRVKRCKLT